MRDRWPGVVLVLLIPFVFVLAWLIVADSMDSQAQTTRADEGLVRQIGYELSRQCEPVFKPFPRCKGSLADYSEYLCGEMGHECLQKMRCGEFGIMMLVDRPKSECLPDAKQQAKP